MGYNGRLSLKILEKSVKVENLPYSLLRGQPLKIKPVFPIAHVAHRAINIKTSSLMIVVEGKELTMKKKC